MSFSSFPGRVKLAQFYAREAGCVCVCVAKLTVWRVFLLDARPARTAATGAINWCLTRECLAHKRRRTNIVTGGRRPPCVVAEGHQLQAGLAKLACVASHFR